MNRPLGLILVLMFTTIVGCKGDKPTYANVKGKVTFNDKPIEKGKIIFAIEGRAPSTMDIVDGKFNGQAMVGSNKVSISAKRKAATAPALPPNAQIQIQGYREKFKREPNQGAGNVSDYDAASVEYIPPEWGSQSTQTRVVEAGVPNEFEIEIKVKR